MVQYNFSEYGLILETPETVYYPKEDSFLLLENIHVEPQTQMILEIGSGSGIISLSLAKKNQNKIFLVTDLSIESCKIINKNLVLNTINSQFDIICCDKISAIRSFNPDVVIWNPPYLPNEEIIGKISFEEKIMLFGGEKGYEENYALISELKNLKKNLIYFTIFSSLAWEKDNIRDIVDEKTKVEVLAEQQLFFEKLFVVKIVING